ncbi:MAG: peptidase C15 [Prochlorothrix sp.]
MASFLLTSFDIWLDRHASNSSDDLLGLLQQNQQLPPDCQLLRRLPVEVEGAFEAVRSAIEHHPPDLVICCGMAETRSHLELEQRAIDCPIQASPENAAELESEPSLNSEPDADPSPDRDLEPDPDSSPELELKPEKALQTSLDLVSLAADLTQTRISTDAGRFVCNGLYFRVLDWLSRSPQSDPACQALFVHVPRLTAENQNAIVADFVTVLDRLGSSARDRPGIPGRTHKC